MKYLISSALAVALVLSVSVFGHGAAASNGDYRVTITNLSNTVLTPPVVAISDRDVDPFFMLGGEASVSLEMIAEGGMTGDLAEDLDAEGATVVEHDAPILPGESAEIMIDGSRRGALHLASMLLPTNDAFIAVSGKELRELRREGNMIYLKAYDAGTEHNSEDCADIPGPQCGGEGYNADRDDANFIHPHAGIHGEGELMASEYGFGNPVAKVMIERIR